MFGFQRTSLLSCIHWHTLCSWSESTGSCSSRIGSTYWEILLTRVHVRIAFMLLLLSGGGSGILGIAELLLIKEFLSPDIIWLEHFRADGWESCWGWAIVRDRVPHSWTMPRCQSRDHHGLLLGNLDAIAIRVVKIGEYALTSSSLCQGASWCSSAACIWLGMNPLLCSFAAIILISFTLEAWYSVVGVLGRWWRATTICLRV